MPASSPPEQKTHAEQARETLDFAESMDTPESPVRELLAALVQAQLAIAEELRAMNGRLDSLIGGRT